MGNLVLTRKAKEKIVISENTPNQIVITITKIQGDKVSVAIEADKDRFPISRPDAKEKFPPQKEMETEEREALLQRKP
jgi:sRNA-binding carbon storage regulator CsrA